MSGRGRRGAPPLPRQRAALRVVQLTLVVLGIVLALMAVRAWGAARASAAGGGEAAVLSAGAVLSASAAAAMGLRTVRGPRPPDL